MKHNQYSFKTEVWLYPGMAGWHFVSVPQGWKTSIFPDNKTGTYLLPLKADVRKKEKIGAGDTIMLSLEIQV
jgi:hypothetical protein